VQHCHILDHEDQGMMQIVEVVNTSPSLAKINGLKPAPEMLLTDAFGGQHIWGFGKYLGHTTVVFLFEGASCLNCSVQIKEYIAKYEDFKNANISVLGVSSKNTEDLLEGLKDMDIHFPLSCDISGNVMRDFGCMGLHGTFIVDSDGNIRWQHIASLPFLNVEEVFQKAVEINDKAKSIKDFY